MLVFDLGGGTFDTVLLERSRNLIEVHCCTHCMRVQLLWHLICHHLEGQSSLVQKRHIIQAQTYLILLSASH